MWPTVGVELQIALQRAFQVGDLCEVAPAELHAPVLVEDRALEAFHEAVGERVSGLGSRVPNREPSARIVEGSLELAAAIGEDAANFPASLSEVGNHSAAEEAGRDGRCGVAQEDHRQAV